MHAKPGTALTYVKLVATMTLWGGTFIAGRLLAGMDAASGAFLRFVAATLFLTAVTLHQEGKLTLAPREQWGPVLFLALTGVFFYNICFLWGLQTVPAGHASLIIACIPAIIALSSAVLFKERLTPLKLLGVALSITGAMTVISQGNPLAVLEHAGLGDLIIFGCVVSWVAYTLMGKKVMGTMTPLAAVTWSCILGSLMLLPVALATGLAGELARASAGEFAGCAYLGVCGTGLGFTWYYQGIQRLGAARAGIFINLVPVNAVTMGWLLLGEPVGMSLVAGAGLIITGVYLVNKPPRLRPAA